VAYSTAKLKSKQKPLHVSYNEKVKGGQNMKERKKERKKEKLKKENSE
jgi:hypothetical protein